MRHLTIIIIASIFFVKSYAQKQHYSIVSIGNHGDTINKISGNTDSIGFQKRIKLAYFKLLKKGYILAEINQNKEDTLFQASILIGESYKWGSFNINQLPNTLLRKSGYGGKSFEKKKISLKKLEKLLIRIREELDYSGYPFSTIMFDSVIVVGEQISATVIYKPGPQIKYAALAILGDEFVKKKYLEVYLGVKRGDLFDSRKVENIEKKMNDLTFSKQESPPQIKFENKKCYITLSISPIKTNKIDAIIGLSSNPLTTKMQITGYVNLELQNLFKYGKELSFSWRQFGVKSQILKVVYKHTNLFKSTINVSPSIDLLKQDTSFINTNISVETGYVSTNYSLSFTSSFITSQLLSDISLTPTRDLTDFKAQYYGIKFGKSDFDFLINPTRGWGLTTNIDIGKKEILRTPFVPEIFYKSLKTQLLQSRFSLIADFAIPISPFFVAYSKLTLASISSNGRLFINDLYRLGGVNSLRGFNELEKYASSYTMVQLEGRLLISKKSRVFGFLDLAFLEDKTIAYTDTFTGLGLGLLLDTPSGVLQLVYSVGKSPKQSLSLEKSKIHFGYVARF